MMHVCAPVSAVSALLLSAIRGELTLRAQTALLGGGQRIDSNKYSQGHAALCCLRLRSRGVSAATCTRIGNGLDIK